MYLKSTNNQQAEKKKPKFVISGFVVFAALLVFLGLFLLTPLPQVIISKIPPQMIKGIFKHAIQTIPLDESGTTLKEPQKYTHTKNLPVLGWDSGICFRFRSTIQKENKNAIDAQRLQGATYNSKPIAEVITIGTNGKEYSLKATVVLTNKDEHKDGVSYICQKFDNTYSAYPSEITAVYVRPLHPFTPSRIVWATATRLR